MTLNIHPAPGTIVICDFKGMVEPEITKRRPAIVVSPRFRNRSRLCTIVPLSTTPPIPPEKYHYKLYMDEPLPEPYNAPMHWVKADMLYTVAFSRLSLPFEGKDASGNRLYTVRIINPEEMEKVQSCILHGIGLGGLTNPTR